MNVVRNLNAAPARGRARGRGRGRLEEQIMNVLPKYRFDFGIRKPLVDLCPTDSNTLKTSTRNRTLKSASTSSFLPSSTRRGSNTTRSPGSNTSTESCVILGKHRIWLIIQYFIRLKNFVEYLFNATWKLVLKLILKYTSDGRQHVLRGYLYIYILGIPVTSGRGEARGEVGIAAIDVHHSHLILCQMSDYQTYINTLTKIYVFNPVEILMPDTMCNESKNRNKLYCSIKEKFRNLCITPVSRIHFSESSGLERIKTHCAKEYSTVELYLKQKYYALAAAAALLKYIEFIQHIVYAPKSIRVEFQGSPNTTVIDIESAQSLELVVSQCGQPNISLLGSMDHCVTPMGRRLLRASILQPPCDEKTIIDRQNSVAELVSNRSLRNLIQPVVRKLYGADRLLSLSMITWQSNTIHNAERNLNYVLLLKNSLDIVPELREVLQSGQALFFNRVRENLQNSQFEIMKSKILEIIHPDAKSLVGYTSSNMQRCFAIKPGINDLLDIARQTYCELIQEMKTLVENLAIKYKINLSLECNSSLGFYILAEIPRQSNIQASDLPSEFIQVQKNRNTYSMTNNKLLVLSHQCKIACEDLHVMSNTILNDLLVKIREHIGCLYQLSADIAELDLIVSLAFISSSPEYVQPKFGPRLELIDSLHPIMGVFGIERPVPNDVRASVPYNHHTIIGPNMSGKSIYLKQIVLLHIMAQIGSYVPARKAEFRIADRIFCRICFRDDIECNASTFVVEMKEAQYILQSITSRSLVILDELCRGTTVEEGSSITWAICERLLITTAFSFSATHFRYLTKLAEIYHNVTNHCFKTETKLMEGLNESRLIYTHKLMVGVTPMDNYGIALAEVSGLPTSITAKAREYAKIEVRTIKKDQYFTEPNSWEKTCYDRVAEMYKLIENNEFNRRNIVGLIHELDICNTDEFRQMQEEDRELCRALESFESIQSDNLTWRNVQVSSTIPMIDASIYFDTGTNLNKKLEDIIDNNFTDKVATQLLFEKEIDLEISKEQPNCTKSSTRMSCSTSNKTDQELMTLKNTSSTLMLNMDKSTNMMINAFTSQSVLDSLHCQNTNNIDKNDSSSITTMSVMSPLVASGCSKVSELCEYLPNERYFLPSLSDISKLSEVIGIGTDLKETKYFKKNESQAFDKFEFT